MISPPQSLLLPPLADSQGMLVSQLLIVLSASVTHMNGCGDCGKGGKADY